MCKKLNFYDLIFPIIFIYIIIKLNENKIWGVSFEWSVKPFHVLCSLDFCG